ncbi:MAG: hypothetical protein JEY94_09275 [Melioribacteraceae bacterium]|nr:hypothetical protein [Melioribacteraceae bacterium]
MNKKLSISEKIRAGETIVNNLLEFSDIRVFVEPFGYTTEKLGECKTIIDSVKELDLKQKKEYGEQYAATQNVEKEWAEANKEYSMMLKLARLVFKKDPQADNALELNGRRKQSLTGWIGQASSFYNNLLAYDELKSKLTRFGITDEKLTAGKTLVDDLVKATEIQSKEIGDAQAATKVRDAKIDEMDDMLEELEVVVRIALEDQPQWLEKLGIFEKS